ncbi:SGNH/GDSL hydrolase family protein [Agrobacterium cavarae]
MTDKLSWDELQTIAKRGELTPGLQRSLFKVDKKNPADFSPKILINKRKVDVGDAAPDAEDIRALFRANTIANNPPLKFSASSAAASTKIKVVSEGDSWFNLPDLLPQYPKDAIDFLSEDFDVNNVALWGDELKDMVANKQYVHILKAGLRHHFLLSGGGNDVLGSIVEYVKKRRAGDTDPENARSYVKPSFADKVEEIIGLFDRVTADICDIRDNRQRRVTLYVHGYAYAIPKPNGPYLGKRLAALGFDPAEVKPLASAIVAHMVNMFNAALKSFAASHANVVYVDLRKVVRASEWNWDEIHPSKEGARKVAATFADAIRRNE